MDIGGTDGVRGRFQSGFHSERSVAESLHQYNARLLNVALDHYLRGQAIAALVEKTSNRQQLRAAMEGANDLVKLAGVLGLEWTQAIAGASKAETVKSLVHVYPYGYGLAYVASHAHDDPTLADFFKSALLIWGAFYSRVELT